MRLATRAHIAALVTLMLCAAVSAQTLRSPQDPRNQAPTVGTGGPVGGPTGLFTIYDGDTIRKGEFTFSVAYSNYDRDPGNVDLVDTPLSFNVGLNDHVELFFKTNGYRGVKVNNPQNLSSFYLPNSQLFFGAATRCVGGAIILSPERVSGSTDLTGYNPLFRPVGPPCGVGGQPFRQFPFIGATGPNFGLTGNNIAPPFVSRIGTPNGGNGSFGSASNFPGMGSVFGSILPGIVLSTTVLPCTALTGNCRPPAAADPQSQLVVPVTFTIAPTYLPDAPFINRLYGESSFTDMVVGAKIRLTSPNNALGVGFIPFYRWYPDKANDFQGFNQLQRGASPGGDIGDFGVVGFASGRLSQHVNVSANVGYILNSNPKSEAMNDAVLLDRPDEFLAGVGFDFPINKHFQLIAEARSTMYVAGKTPNAFNNNPVDVIGGVRIFPNRWWGFGFAYRRHMNQQDAAHFNEVDANIQIQNLSGVFVPGRGVVVVPGTTRPATVGGRPVGYNFSDDPNGFIFQFWIGHRNSRIPPNLPPTVSLSPGTVTLPCPPGTSSDSCPSTASNSIQLTANGVDPERDPLVYTWNAKGGSASPSGQTLNWTFTEPGSYEVSVTVDDGHNPPVTSLPVTVVVDACKDCVPPCPPRPTVSVSCTGEVTEGAPITFTATSAEDVTYNWTVSTGTISSGHGTSTITVDSTGLGGQIVTATVEVVLKGDYRPACLPLTATASCPTSVRQKIGCKKVDEYGDIRFDDEKARLDNLAIAANSEPDSTVYIVAYGTCAGNGLCSNPSCIVAQKRMERAKDYLVTTRGIDASRIVTIDGGCRSQVMVELWVCPKGADPLPAATTSADTVDPCPECKPRPRPRRRRGARDE